MKLLAKKRSERPATALDVSEMIKSNLQERDKVKSFTEFKQDTNEFLRAVESSAANLISVAAEIKPEVLEECTAVEQEETKKSPIPKYLALTAIILTSLSAVAYFTIAN